MFKFVLTRTLVRVKLVLKRSDTMKKILKTMGVLVLVYVLAIGATFIMSARVEKLDSEGVSYNTSVSLR